MVGKVRTAGALCLQLLVPFVSIILLVENRKIGRTLGAINLDMCLSFHCPYMLFSAQRVAAGWFGDWSHDLNILGMFQI